MALTHTGVPFEDLRIKYEIGWQKKIKTPFGVLPILEIDGKVLPESMAILRYIGEQHGLQANNPFDRALGDAIATTWMDLHPLFNACDFTTMKWDLAKVEEVMDLTVKSRLKFIDEHLSKNKEGYLTGDKVTWVDFYVYTFVSMLKGLFQAPLEPYPHLIQFQKKIDELPRVKSWHQNHPNDTWGSFPGPYGDK